jgi:hypothetical protein
MGLFGKLLKLTGHIDWSWWWVTSPLWGTFILSVAPNIWAKDEAPKTSKWRQRLEEMQAKQQAERLARKH